MHADHDPQEGGVHQETDEAHPESQMTCSGFRDHDPGDDTPRKPFRRHGLPEEGPGGLTTVVRPERVPRVLTFPPTPPARRLARSIRRARDW